MARRRKVRSKALVEFCAGSSLAIVAALQTNPPFDSLKDFAGVSQLGFSTGALTVTPSLGVRSVKDLIALAKAQPGKLVYGSGGAGQASHLNGETFRLAAGIDVVNVPFKARADSLIKTAAGRVHYCFSGLAPALPFINDRKLLALAVTTPQRSPVLPDLPAMGEIVSGFVHDGAYALVAPRRRRARSSNG